MKNDGAAIKWRAEHEGSSIFPLVSGIIVTSRFYIIHESWRRNVAMKKQLH